MESCFVERIEAGNFAGDCRAGEACAKRACAQQNGARQEWLACCGVLCSCGSRALCDDTLKFKSTCSLEDDEENIND